jgi:hypothetical protein
MFGVCTSPNCEVLGFIVIRIGKRLEWWTCSKHYPHLVWEAEFVARPWERITSARPSALVMGDLQAWRTWVALTRSAYDELRQI